MSKRIPPTSADRAVTELLGRCPELETMPEGIVLDTMDNATLAAAGALGARDGRCSRGVDPFTISLWTHWRACRHVYRFDHALSAQLTETKAPDSMPTEVLERMPYPIIYVEAPVYVVTTADRRVDARGFFAYLDLAVDSHDEPVRSLTLVYVTPGFVRDLTPVHLCLTGGTLGEIVDELAEGDAIAYNATQEGHREAVRRCIVCALSHLLYVIDGQSDQSVSYVPSAAVSRKRARQTSRSTIHSVGVRVGKALGAPTVRYMSGGTESGSSRKSPRAHVRAGHWSHYWTGPKKGPVPQTLEVRWIAPTLVGVGSDSAPTTLHETSKK